MKKEQGRKESYKLRTRLNLHITPDVVIFLVSFVI